MDAWFTEPGSTGELSIEHRDDGWYVASSDPGTEIKCILQNDDLIDPSSTEQHVEATVSRFTRGASSDKHFLFLKAPDPAEEQKSSNGRSDNQDNNTDNSSQGVPGSTDELWQLKDFRGSGEYANLEATIDAVFYVKKGVGGMPDMKGELIDESVPTPTYFVVEEGVSHPYLEEGKRFLFKNVKDHYYSTQAEVQVLINDNTEFVER